MIESKLLAWDYFENLGQIRLVEIFTLKIYGKKTSDEGARHRKISKQFFNLVRVVHNAASEKSNQHEAKRGLLIKTLRPHTLN